MSTPNGQRQHAPAVIPQNTSDSIESAPSPRSTSLGGRAGDNGDAEKPVPTQDASRPSVPARTLRSSDLRSSDMLGSAGRTDNGVAEGAERAVLLATKLHVPAVGGALVHRATLLDALSAGLRRKLTLLSAPAGWGKTTLLAQWALGAGEDQHFGWLSLDPSDNDPMWFWMYVVAALQKVSPGVGIRAVELLAMGADPVQVVLPTLLNDLDTMASPMVLILDDYHLVVNRAVHEQLAFVIGRMPANLHLVLATRSDPALPLARLRGSGELAELRSDDLRFGAIEAEHLLNDVLGLDLADADIQLLHRRTEGWAAGLYLAGLSLAGRQDAAAYIRTFAGDNRHIVDYLMAEVLDNQPPQTAQLPAADLGAGEAERCVVRRDAANLGLGLGLGEDRARKPVCGATGHVASLVSVSPAVRGVAARRAAAQRARSCRGSAPTSRGLVRGRGPCR